MSKDMSQKSDTKPATSSNPKQGTSKTAPPSKPAPKPSSSGSRPPSGQPQSSASKGQQTPQRPQRRAPTTRQAPPPSTGFGSRDLTLLIGGVMVVVFVVIGALIFGSRNSNTATPDT